MKPMPNPTLVYKRLLLTVCAAASLGGALTACVPIPLLVGSAVAGGAMVVTDRRTAGAQLDDERIERHARAQLNDHIGSRARVSVTSYNRQVLLTGEVMNPQDKLLVEQLVTRVANVRGVSNEVDIINSPSFVQRTSDVLITGQVKAYLIDAKDVPSNTIKVVTERGTVFLMGLVTQQEAEKATEIARSARGVEKVVRIFELISDEAAMPPAPLPAASPLPGSKG
jgi:osmotically-inducible protein OsmY